MSDDSQDRIRRFEIINFLYDSATRLNKRNLRYTDIANELQVEYGNISMQIRTLISLGYVFSPILLSATLSPKAMNVMERRPQPKDYDEFVDMFNNPQKPFGEPVRIKGPRGSFWEEHPILKIITPIGAIASIIALVIGLYLLSLSNTP